jgi:hypothetical protein
MMENFMGKEIVDNYIKVRVGGDSEMFFFDSRIPEKAREAYQAAVAAKRDFDTKAPPLRGAKVLFEGRPLHDGRAHISVWRICSGLPPLPQVGEVVTLPDNLLS